MANEDATHNVKINPVKARKGVTERESFGTGKPACVSDAAWANCEPALKAMGDSAASDKQNVDAVYINLETRPDRRDSIEGELAKAGLKAKRLSAMRGVDATDACVSRTWDTSINCQYDDKCIKNGSVSLTPGERGCSMSHVVMWARCAAQGDDGAPLLVVEDDVQFKKDAGEHVRQLVAHLEETNPVPSQRLMLLYLTGDVAAWRHSRSQKIATCPGVTLREAEYVWQTACYIIWPAAARRLLASLPVDGPVDNFISKHSRQSQLCALVTTPKLAWQAAPYEEGDIAHSGHVNSIKPRKKLLDHTNLGNHHTNGCAGAKKEQTALSPTTGRVCSSNTAEDDSEEAHLMHHLADVWGIGPKLAQTLREHVRNLEGGLTREDQLDGVAGLGNKRKGDIVRYLQLTPAAPRANSNAKKRANELISSPLKVANKQQKMVA